MPWATLHDRLKAKLVPDPETGCLLWTGCTSTGYGMIFDGPWPRQVHRVAWEMENGPIPDGLVIDHVYARGCRHKNCANVAHMELVTPGENVRRSAVARRARRVA